MKNENKKDAISIKERFKNLSYESQIAMNAKVELLRELETLEKFKEKQPA